MPVPSNTVQTFAMVGIREDLSDVITLTDPTDTPFYSGIAKGSAKNRTPEWQVDTLAAPDPANAAIEGDDPSNDVRTQPVRIRNVVQLFDKIIQVSSTARAVETAGRADELAYQVVKSGKELKRDMEARFTGNFASVLGAAGTAGQAAGAEAYLTTNVSRGATGANGGYNSGTGLIAAATDGTQRTSTEALLKTVIQATWTSGGNPAHIMVNGVQKQTYSGFPGIATQFNALNQSGKNTIVGGIDVYKSDFGIHTIVPNRFMGYGTGRTRNTTNANRTALVLDMSSWSVNFLQPMKTVDLAKTGHSDRKMIFAEATLECSDEKKNGIVADLL
jgi:hypothetical protein